MWSVRRCEANFDGWRFHFRTGVRSLFLAKDLVRKKRVLNERCQVTFVDFFIAPALSANPPVEQFGIRGTRQVQILGRQILVIDEDQTPDNYVMKIITTAKNLHLNNVLSPLHDDDKDKLKETCQKKYPLRIQTLNFLTHVFLAWQAFQTANMSLALIEATIPWRPFCSH